MSTLTVLVLNHHRTLPAPEQESTLERFPVPSVILWPKAGVTFTSVEAASW